MLNETKLNIAADLGRAVWFLAMTGVHACGLADGSNDAENGKYDVLAARAKHQDIEMICSGPAPEGYRNEAIDSYNSGYRVGQSYVQDEQGAQKKD